MFDATHVIVSLIGLIGVITTSIFGYLTHKHAREINDAVNHRHEKRGEGAPKMYDLVWENHQKADELLDWKRSYEGGPLDHGAKVKDFVDGVHERLEKIEDKLCPEQ